MLLRFDPPARSRATEEHNQMFSSDSGVAGTYVPNMSQADNQAWKGKHLNAGKPEARVEIRKQTSNWTQMLIVVAPEGWDTRPKKGDTEPPSLGPLGVKISLNGPAKMTFDELKQLTQAVFEARQILEGELTK